ncbi:hypothetical protein [Entomoplasma freundtii]|nr:hypothetical protein [Entomoplasma freundtii]
MEVAQNQKILKVMILEKKNPLVAHVTILKRKNKKSFSLKG